MAALVAQLAKLFCEITAASNEQRSGIEEVNCAIVQMDEVTQQNAALVEQAAAAAESLQEQAAQLVQAVSVFRLHSSDKLIGVPTEQDKLRLTHGDG